MTIKINKDSPPQILKLSASSIKTFEQCPMKYKFSYIDRAPKRHWDHFDLGNVCHKALELFHLEYIKDGTSKRTLGKMMGAAFEKARLQFPNLKDELAAEAKNMISDYLKYVQKNGMPMVKGCETSFEFHLKDDALIRGFVDRVDILKNGQLRIIDYKTTKNEKYLDDFQLSVYGLWLKQDYPELDSFTGAYVLLKHKSKLKEFVFNSEDIEKTRKKLIDYANRISVENTWTPIPTPLCNWCDFKDLCEAHKSW